jgi:hypothetical protein
MLKTPLCCWDWTANHSLILRSAKGEYTNKINKMLDNINVTQDGRDWLMQILDPFPDYRQRIVGMPDENQASSLTRKIKLSFNIQCPTSVVTPTFDCLICFVPNLFEPSSSNSVGVKHPRSLYMGKNGTVTDPTNSSNAIYGIGPVFSYCVESGNTVFPTSGLFTDNAAGRFTKLDLTPYLNTSRVRMLGGGIEVTNTTPELYRSGAISVCDISSEFISVNILTNDQTINNYNSTVPAHMMNAPISNLASMRQAPGSVRWNADDGCYAVLRQSKKENPFRHPVSAAQLYYADYFVPTSSSEFFGLDYTGVGNFGVPINTSATNGTFQPYLPPPSLPVPFDMKCILLTGCDSHSTFTVDLNLLLEYIPAQDNFMDQALSVPSPRYDPIAIELYSRVMSELPPAVPVWENAEGDWWEKVLDGIAKWAPSIGSVVPLPGAGAIGSLVGQSASAGKLLGNWIQDRAKADIARKEAKKEKKEVERLAKNLADASLNARPKKKTKGNPKFKRIKKSGSKA